uniref:Uncharacterized protein n=1 Tax=viral metagenome TaxID=1070528 RepID=A0A6C0L0U2_9ZZZZ
MEDENTTNQSSSSDNESSSSDDVSDTIRLGEVLRGDVLDPPLTDDSDSESSEDWGEGYLPNRIHALDIDNDTLGAARMHPVIDTIDEVYRIEHAFNDRREYLQHPGMVMVMKTYRGPTVETPTFQRHRIKFNANQIINRWESELDSFGLNMSQATRAITFKAFSNYTDIIEDLIHENLALKSIINAKNTDLEKLTFLLEGKTSNKIVNKLPEELDKKIVKYLGGRRRYRMRHRKLKYLFS